MSLKRKEINNKFLEENKINKKLSIICNNETYTQETVMTLVYLPYWKRLSKEDRFQCVVWIFENLLEQQNLEGYLDHILFIPKVGYEDAFGSYDKEDKSIFINPQYIKSTSLLCIWNLFHEVQHAVQHKDEELIRKGKLLRDNVYNSFAYYFMYDGTSYRFNSKEDFIYKVKGTEEFCLELYLRNPMEIDANNKAYLNLKDIIKSNFVRYGDDDETTEDFHKIKEILIPRFNVITDDISVDVIKYCQTLIELSYQFSKENINEGEYKRKNMELYTAIELLIRDKKHIELSFNPNNILCKNDYF